MRIVGLYVHDTNASVTFYLCRGAYVLISICLSECTVTVFKQYGMNFHAIWGQIVLRREIVYQILREFIRELFYTSFNGIFVNLSELYFSRGDHHISTTFVDTALLWEAPLDSLSGGLYSLRAFRFY